VGKKGFMGEYANNNETKQAMLFINDLQTIYSDFMTINTPI